jgi:hypothetical protein
MDTPLTKSNRAQQQAHYPTLAEQYHERADQSPEGTVAVGYVSLANDYEVFAQRLGKPS